MAISRYTPLPLWALVAVLVFVTSVTPQPIRTRRWAKPGEVEDLEGRGLWKAFGEEESTPEDRLSRAEHALVSNTYSITIVAGLTNRV